MKKNKNRLKVVHYSIIYYSFFYQINCLTMTIFFTNFKSKLEMQSDWVFSVYVQGDIIFKTFSEIIRECYRKRLRVKVRFSVCISIFIFKLHLFCSLWCCLLSTKIQMICRTSFMTTKGQNHNFKLSFWLNVKQFRENIYTFYVTSIKVIYA